MLPILLAVALSAPSPALKAHRAWVAAGQPLVVEVPNGDNPASLVLLQHDGTVLDGPHSVESGPLEVITLLPAINTLDHAAYLQLLVGDAPQGAALVVQPALSRRVPMMERRHDDDRGDWNTIGGWRDEGADDHEDLPDSVGVVTGAAMPQPVPRDDVVIRSGWWVTPEVDCLMDTDHGTLHIDVREDAAPNTARNFTSLAMRGFYDGTTAHRIIPKGRAGRPFVVQGGDPIGTGSGGPGWWLPIEPSTLGHAFGVLSMARADDPDSAGSQWFIALDRAECARLDGLYCAFGEVVKGRDALVAMAQLPLADTDYLSSRPIKPPRIARIWCTPAPGRTPLEGRPDHRVLPPTDGLWAE
jgi:cyclophilin family peptidyl-prolyl cis-trans isomerase